MAVCAGIAQYLVGWMDILTPKHSCDEAASSASDRFKKYVLKHRRGDIYGQTTIPFIMNASAFAFWHLRSCRVVAVPLVAWCLWYSPSMIFLSSSVECVGVWMSVFLPGVADGPSPPTWHWVSCLLLWLTLWLIYPSPPPAAALFNLHFSIPQRVCEHRAALCSSACLFPRVVCSAFPFVLLLSHLPSVLAPRYLWEALSPSYLTLHLHPFTPLHSCPWSHLPIYIYFFSVQLSFWAPITTKL